MRAVSEFLVREVLPLVAAAAPQINDHEDSLTQDGSELSEAQLAQVLDSPKRLMLVRYTNVATQSLTLVDRSHSIDAFLPQSLLERLKTEKNLKNFSRVRGSMIRVDKYHYTTPAHCLASDEFVKRKPQSVTTASGHALSPICLWIEAMDIVDDGDLAVNPLPDLLEHPDIAKEIRAIKSDHDLEKRLMGHQGLAVSAATCAVQPIDDEHPLLDEDCEIPSDQEEALKVQEGWGSTQSQQPSDSQLINENGPVTLESQQEDSQPLETRHFSAETESSSQDAHFQKENIRQAFIQCDDTDSDEEQESQKTKHKAVSQETSSKAEESSSNKRTDLEGDVMQVPLFTARSDDIVDISYEDSERESTQPVDEPNVTDVTGEEEDLEAFFPEEPCTQAPDSPHVDASMSQHDPDLNASESQYMVGGGMDDDWHTQPSDDTLLFNLSSQAPKEMLVVDEVAVDDFAPQTPPGAVEQSNTVQPHEASSHDITSTTETDAIAEPELQPSRSPSPVVESKRKRVAKSGTVRPAKAQRVTFSVQETDTDKQPSSDNSRQKKTLRAQDQPSNVRSRLAPAARAPTVPAFLLNKDRVVVEMPYEFPAWRKPDPALGRMARPSRRYAHLYPPLDMEKIKQMIADKD